MNLSILHVSDLHRDPANPISNQVLLDSLERDRDRYTSKENPRIAPPNLIIVSGDIVQGVIHGSKDAEAILAQQYDQALAFLNDLTDRFVDGDKRRIVIVPGNHDVSDHQFRESLTPIAIAPDKKKEIIAQLFQPDSPLRWSWEEFALYEIADWSAYHQRFAAYSDFYGKFYGQKRSFPITPNKQTDVFDYPDLGITIVGFCSCYNNDLLNRRGAIHPDCIALAGSQLREICLSHNPLRIAVWHHNTEGSPVESDYMDPDTVQNFIDGGFSLGFHGHQHRPQFLDTRFRHGPDRRITVISAGTLCGGAAFRHGRAYNIVEIDVKNRAGRLHLREMQNDNLRMPIWGARSLPPNHTSYFDFAFEAPPEPFAEPDGTTIMLRKAQAAYDSGDYRAAADSFSPLVSSDPLARRLYLESLIRLNDHPTLIASYDPPQSTVEAIALMDALWAQGEREQLAQVLKLEVIAASSDPSVSEIRKKYMVRLRK